MRSKTLTSLLRSGSRSLSDIGLQVRNIFIRINDGDPGSSFIFMKILTFGQETFLPIAVFVECVEFFIDPMNDRSLYRSIKGFPCPCSFLAPGKVEFHTVRISLGGGCSSTAVGSTVRRRLGIWVGGWASGKWQAIHSDNRSSSSLTTRQPEKPSLGISWGWRRRWRRRRRWGNVFVVPSYNDNTLAF